MTIENDEKLIALKDNMDQVLASRGYDLELTQIMMEYVDGAFMAGELSGMDRAIDQFKKGLPGEEG